MVKVALEEMLAVEIREIHNIVIEDQESTDSFPYKSLTNLRADAASPNQNSSRSLQGTLIKSVDQLLAICNGESLVRRLEPLRGDLRSIFRREKHIPLLVL